MQVDVPLCLDLPHFAVIGLDDPAFDAFRHLCPVEEELGVRETLVQFVPDDWERAERLAAAVDVPPLHVHVVLTRLVVTDVQERQLILVVRQHDREPRRRPLERRSAAGLEAAIDPCQLLRVLVQELRGRERLVGRECLLRLRDDLAVDLDEGDHRAVTLVHNAHDAVPRNHVRL